MKPIYIAIGANMSNPKKTLLNLSRVLAKRDIRVIAASSLWRNPAWPEGRGFPDFLNGVFQIEFNGCASELLHIFQDTETQLGRVKTARNAPRPLDLDIIDFRGEVRIDRDLELPHPRTNMRAFVLLPLAEIAPNWRHPISKLNALEALARLPLSAMETMQFETHMKPAD